MTTLMANASGNFSSSSTWGLVDVTSVAFLDSQAGSTALTTSMVYSATFTGLSSTIDGIAVKVAARTGTTGTMTVVLNNGTTDFLTLAINVSDLPSGQAGWVFFKFGSNTTLVAGTTYKVGAKTSSAGQVTLYRNATAGNWARALRTTAATAPTAASVLIVCGERTGAGTSNTLTVTMDNTSNATIYGKTTVSDKGVWTCGTTASTNYYFKLAGLLEVFDGATMNWGTVGTPVPSTSTAVVEFSNASNVQFGLQCYGGTFNSCGASKTISAVLGSDAAATNTSLTLSSSPTGWGNTDKIFIEATTAVGANAEAATMSAVSGATLTVPAIAHAHSGTGRTAANVCNLTRNVKIFSASSTNNAYVNVGNNCVFAAKYTEFTNMGSAVAGTRGIDANPTTGSVSITFCSIHDFTVAGSLGCYMSNAAGTNFTFSSNVMWNIANDFLIIVATTGTWTVDSNIMCLNVTASTEGVLLQSCTGTFTNNVISSTQFVGFWFNQAAAFASCTGNVAHSCGNAGIYIDQLVSVGAANSWKLWCNNNAGLYLAASGGIIGSTFDSILVFDNVGGGINTFGEWFNVKFTNGVFDGGTAGNQTTNLAFEPGGVGSQILFQSCTFGVLFNSSVGDIYTTTAVNGISAGYTVGFENCQFSSTTTFSGQNLLSPTSLFTSQKHNQTAGLHKWWAATGTGSIDTTLYHNASPSTRLTPLAATTLFSSQPQAARVANGSTITFSVWVRISVIGDGATYNGAAFPTLTLKANVAAGIASDIVLATATSAAQGAWQQISGTTAAVTDDAVLQVVVTCEGTTGWVNIDDFAAA